MCGLTLRPASTAFFASKPAASSTLGLEVLVQLVMAAISTSPLPMVMSAPDAGSTGASVCAEASVGLLPSISATWRGAPKGVGMGLGSLSGNGSPDVRAKCLVWKTAALWLNPFSELGLENSDSNCAATLPSSMRSCGRLGPAKLGVTLPKSSLTTCE